MDKVNWVGKFEVVKVGLLEMEESGVSTCCKEDIPYWDALCTGRFMEVQKGVWKIEGRGIQQLINTGGEKRH